MKRLLDFPWVTPPPDFEAFDLAAVIDTPAVGTETTVLALQVPTGWDGVLRTISHTVAGPSFQEGSGDLVWRLRLDSRYLRHYGAMKVQFGSAGQPRQTAGILLKPGQVLRYSVANTAYAAAGTKIVCSVGGWFWKQGVFTW